MPSESGLEYVGARVDAVRVIVYKQNPQSARRNNFPGGQISRWFLLLSEHLSASNYPGAAYTEDRPYDGDGESCEDAVINPTLVVVFDVDSVGRRVIRETIGEVADILYLTDVLAAERADVLRRADVIFAQHTAKDLTTDELSLIRRVRLLQFYTAGVDFIPLQALPAECPIATNGGAFAEPMAEHALAMTFAAAKRLFIEHHHLAHGAFHQFAPNRMLGGRVCGVFGFGGVGVATARLMRAMGMTIHAINRRGYSAAPTEWIGTPDHLDVLLRAADVLVIAAPLSHATVGCIGAREF